MSADTFSPFFTDRLRSCEFFVIYSQAFEVATGYRLNLKVHEDEGAMLVPVRVGGLPPIYLIAEGGSPGKEAALKGLLKSFVLQLEDEVNRALLESDDAEPKCVRAAKNYIKKLLGEKILLDRVSEVLEVCPFLLCRLFKKHTGMTMTEFVSRHRIEKARRILQDPSLQISEVSEQVGFTSISQFNRNFLKYAGEAPSRYRDRLGSLEHCQLMAV